MGTTTERIAELKARRSELTEKINALEAQSGKVAAFIDALRNKGIETGGLTEDMLAKLVVAWEQFKSTGTL